MYAPAFVGFSVVSWIYIVPWILCSCAECLAVMYIALGDHIYRAGKLSSLPHILYDRLGLYGKKLLSSDSI